MMGAAESLELEQFDEAEAARRLTMSKSTLARLRLEGKIHPMRLSPRIIRYTEVILDEYREQCRNAPAKLVSSGSAAAPAIGAGAGHGSMPTLDRQSARLLAQTIFKKQS